MQKNTKRLIVNRETLRALSSRQLSAAAGGMRDISDIIGGCTSTTTGNDTEDCPPTVQPTHWNC